MQKLNLSADSADNTDVPDFERNAAKRLAYEIIGFIAILAAFIAPLLIILISPRGLCMPAVLISFPVAVGILSFATELQRIGRRYTIADAATRIKKDKRPPVLYLRSFLNQYYSNDSRANRVTDEELLTSILKDLAPVVAIGLPQDKIQPFGAARLYLKGDDWKSAVKKLINEAQLVVIEPGYGAGLEWEVKTARELCPPQKLLFSLLPFSLPDTSGHVKDFNKIKDSLEKSLRVTLPDINNSLFLYFDSEWKPYLINLENIESSYYFDFTIIKIRKALRPVLNKRGMKLGKLADIKDLAVSLSRAILFIVLFVWIISLGILRFVEFSPHLRCKIYGDCVNSPVFTPNRTTNPNF